MFNQVMQSAPPMNEVYFLDRHIKSSATMTTSAGIVPHWGEQ